MEVETERHYQMMGRMGHCLRDDLAPQADAIRRAVAGPDQQNSEAVRTGSDVPPPLAPVIGSGMDHLRIPLPRRSVASDSKEARSTGTGPEDQRFI